MGDHRKNPRAQAARQPDPTAIQRMARPDRQLREGIGGQFEPKQNIWFSAPGGMRTSEAGTVEVRVVVDGVEAWKAAPEGVRVLPEGVELGLEDMDYVVRIQSMCVNNTIVDPRGNSPVSVVAMAVLGRVDAVSLMDAHDRNFGGRREEAPTEAPVLVAP